MSGNGVDIGAVYQLLMQVAETVRGHDRKLDLLTETVLGHDRKLDLLTETVRGHDRKLDDVAAGLASLRQAVTEYHSSVLGHGILISELDERVRRIEQHLNLPPVA